LSYLELYIFLSFFQSTYLIIFIFPQTFLPRFFTQQQLAIVTTPHPQKYKDYEPRPTF
jgi:hypothetical protein